MYEKDSISYAGSSKDRHAFTDRLIPFLKKLPAGYKFVIEILNKAWLDAEFADVLREHKAALQPLSRDEESGRVLRCWQV